MQIEERGPATIYRLIIAGLAGYGFWLAYSGLGLDGLRLFSSWFLIFVTIYYICSAAVSLLRRRQPASHVFCPMLQGLLVISGIILLAGKAIFYALDMANPGLGGLEASLVYYILPILVLLDWIVFSEKGRWRAIEPLYWLSLLIVYICVILITATFFTSPGHLCYPYEFLDWPEIGVDGMLWQLAVIAVLVLAFSYLCWLIDFTMSGKLAQTIILPRIKTVVIEDGEIVGEVDKSSLQASEPEEDEPIEVIEPQIKINVEGLKDQKSASKVHKPGAEVFEPKPVKTEPKTAKAESKPVEPKQPSSPKPKPAPSEKPAMAKPGKTSAAKSKPKSKTSAPKVRIVEQMTDLETAPKTKTSKANQAAKQPIETKRPKSEAKPKPEQKSNKKS